MDSYDTVPMSDGKTIPFIIARSSYWSMVYSGIQFTIIQVDEILLIMFIDSGDAELSLYWLD